MQSPQTAYIVLFINLKNIIMKEEKQIRKKSPKNGRTQTRTTFVIDNDVWACLKVCSNKSRLVNDLLRVHFDLYYCKKDGE